MMIYETQITLPMDGVRMLPLSTYIEEALPGHADGLLNIKCGLPETGICLVDKGPGPMDEKLCLEHIEREQDMERRILRRQQWGEDLAHGFTGWHSPLVSYIITAVYHNALWLSDSQEYTLTALTPVKETTVKLSLLTEHIQLGEYPMRIDMTTHGEVKYILRNIPGMGIGRFDPGSIR